ncbi:hypothetical protein CBM2633_P40008 [Cupriavidus taiwanensis]|uniref:Uncharacterized protein n=3 Tax=Cupriavidus TaxID=106589 RepID=A0A375GNR2_9BURK|nr:hypothetical protein pRALTA_0071 [Cupriavidus taiwanensis LMG 19424]SOY76731.1 hypothetical protein CBM2588_P50003 [Cupriavidus taiwanensis]SOZ40735.1 hypothetical protein CBM2605_P40008 [Cupriavidus neocaledonicus]SOY76738.1 hypothetical protein CBM2585_P40010 [Cupriavidus taiwanensis]SOY76764.1 hypothetical protein CBM2592_P60003 [Cupriavidus taiwanensis]
MKTQRRGFLATCARKNLCFFMHKRTVLCAQQRKGADAWDPPVGGCAIDKREAASYE